MTRGLFGWALPLLLLGATCVTGRPAGWQARNQPPTPVVEFPSVRSLAELSAQPATVPTVEAGEIPVEGWRLEPVEVAWTGDQPWQPDDAWSAAVAADVGAAGNRLRMTRPLACVARQIGRFFLQTGSVPPQVLKQFMVAACGAGVPDIGYHWISGKASARISDDRLLSEWRAELRKGLLEKVPSSSVEAGFWFGRGADRAVALMVHIAPKVRWTNFQTITNAEGDLTLEGELLEPSAQIYGMANVGRFGVSPCAVDPSVPRPRFRATCHVAAEDTSAWIELMTLPPKRALATPFVQVLARRSADHPLIFDRRAYGEPHVVGSTAEFAQTILQQLNVVRAQAGMAPVRLSTSESADATGLAAHYFHDVLDKGDGSTADRIALGLLAGWQIAGTIRDGQFISSVVPGTRDAGQWLGAALATPSGRSTLLAKDIEEIAPGTLLLSAPNGLGAIVTGYRLYHGDDHSADVRRLTNRLVAARLHRRLPPPGRLQGIEREMKAGLEQVRAGKTGSAGALDLVLHHGVESLGHGLHGYAVDATSVDAVEIPDAIINRADLRLEIGIIHHRPRGAAWGQLLILIVYADEANGARQI